MPFEYPKPRKVVFQGQKAQPVMGAPPKVTASQAESAAGYAGSAKEASDIAAYRRRPARGRRAGQMGAGQVFQPPAATTGFGGGGGGNGAEEGETPWYQNPWVWAGGLGAVFLFMQRKPRRK